MFDTEEPEQVSIETKIEETAIAIEESTEPRALIQDLIEEGDFVLVQVAKDPFGTKGARITTQISLPGRNLVYMPNVQHFGVSRKIANEEERDRLLKLVEQAKPEGGVIIRTAGEGANKEDLESDLEYLGRLSEKAL